MTQRLDAGTLITFGVILLFFSLACPSNMWSQSDRAESWLAEKERVAVSIDPHIIDPANDGKFVHVVGAVSPQEQDHVDPVFGVSARGYALVRLVWLYDDVDLGRTWAYGACVDGRSPEASDPLRSVVWGPTENHIGAFTLDPELVIRWLYKETGAWPDKRPNGQEKTMADLIRRQIDLAAVKAPLAPSAAPPNGWVRGADGSLSPTDVAKYLQGGNVRVEHRVVVIEGKTATLLCRQSGDRLTPEPTSWANGMTAPFFCSVSVGQRTKADAFAEARSAYRRGRSFALVLAATLVTGGLGLITWGVVRARAGRLHQPVCGAALVKVAEPGAAPDPARM